MAIPDGYRCSCCGEWHEGLPLDLAFDEPHYVQELTAEERQQQVDTLGDFRVLRNPDGTHYFIRGVVEIPILGSTDTFCYGVWTTLSAANFERARAAYAENRAAGPFFGWFANRLPGYPDTLSLKTNVHLRADLRASIELEPTDHPLALEQRDGITFDRVQAIVERALHAPTLH